MTEFIINDKSFWCSIAARLFGTPCVIITDNLKFTVYTWRGTHYFWRMEKLT